MGISARDLIKRTSSPERVHHICLDGKARTQLDELQAELDQAKQECADKLGSTPRVTELTERVAELEKAVDEATYPFRFRGISHWRRKEIEKAFPTDDEEASWDVDAGAPTLISECLVDPKFTPEEMRELLDSGNQRLADEFINAALLVCVERNEVPKSGRGSASTRGSARS